MNSHSVNIIWKTFIKETLIESSPLQIKNVECSHLDSHGDEVKDAYEEIINDNNKINVINNIRKSINGKHVTGSKCNNTNLRCKKNIRNYCESNVKIDPNKILKGVEQGDIEFLSQIMTKENVNIVDNYGWTPLMSAAYCDNELIVKFLLKLGANIKCKDKSGNTALKLAEKKKNLRIIQLLNSSNFIKVKKQMSLNNVEISEFYCPICKLTFKETTVKNHETSTLHVFNTNPKIPDPSYGIPKQNKGYQIMVNNGWNEIQGLGPSGTGLKYPVKTVLKRDRMGFGHKPKLQARVTHFASNDIDAIHHKKQFEININKKNSLGKRDHLRLKNYERRKEIAIRQALS